IYEFMETGFITKVPSALLATGLMIISFLSLFTGLILDTVVMNQKKDYELQLQGFYANYKK
ncbi:glycosyl transferase, partial [Enterococcus cecorum]|nr:glycosyl transferase [Enterococcus cecorum]